MAALAEHGITLRRSTPGEHRAPCPECDRGPRDDALAVRLAGDGSATWLCHRCGCKGGIAPERSERPVRPARARQDKRDEPERYDTLAPWGLALWQDSETLFL
jgi:hypothetical protein